MLLENAAISGDGRYVAFQSNAVDLVPDDTNQFVDVFVRAALIPEVHAVEPNSIAPGAVATLTVTGTGFLAGAQASASLFSKGGVTVESVTVVSDIELEVAVTAAVTRHSATVISRSGIRASVREFRGRVRDLRRLPHRHLAGVDHLVRCNGSDGLRPDSAPASQSLLAKCWQAFDRA